MPISKEIADKYEILDNAFKTTPKDSPKDRIEVEVGDSKDASKVQPQVKVMRWDNEVNASFRLIDSEFDNVTPEFDKDKIKLVGKTKEVHAYDLPPSEELPEGGHELEVILKEKPSSNVLTFSMETKGLNFFYQPPLNEEVTPPDGGSATETEVRDKDGIVMLYRPEYVVGSYVAYHKTKGRMNDVNGMEYKAGVAFNIHRPKIVDAVGNWVWGELFIDAEAGIQTITIPQDFLDNAVYPIKHASGEEIGYHTIGGSVSAYYSDAIQGDFYTMPEDGTVTSISIYNHTGTYDGGPRTWGLYVKDSGGAGTHGYHCNTDIDADPANGDWLTLDVTTGTTALVDGTTYVIVHWGESYSLRYNSGGNVHYYATQAYPDSWPATFYDTSSTNQWSFYCTYDPAGAGGPAGVKTINETAIASIKTIQQTAIANVKTIQESAA